MATSNDLLNAIQQAASTLKPKDVSKAVKQVVAPTIPTNKKPITLQEGINQNNFNQKKLSAGEIAINKSNKEQIAEAEKAAAYKANFMKPYQDAYLQGINNQNQTIDAQNEKIDRQNRANIGSNIMSDTAKTIDAIMSTGYNRNPNLRGTIAALAPEKENQANVGRVTPDYIKLGTASAGEYKAPNLQSLFDATKLTSQEQENAKQRALTKEIANEKLKSKGNDILDKIYKESFELAKSKDITNPIGLMNKNIKLLNDISGILKSADIDGNLAYSKAIDIMYARAKELNNDGKLTDQDFKTAGLSQSWVDKLNEWQSKGLSGIAPENYKEYAENLQKVLLSKMAENERYARDVIKNSAMRKEYPITEGEIDSIISPFRAGRGSDLAETPTTGTMDKQSMAESIKKTIREAK